MRFRLWAGALAAAALFAGIGCAVVTGRTADGDRTLSLAAHRLDSAPMDVAMRFFSMVGSEPAETAVVIAMLVASLRRKDRAAARAMLVVSIASGSLNALLKRTIARPRPTLFYEIDPPATFSFPSGHAMSGMAILGFTAVLLARWWPERSRAVAVVAGAGIFAIGFSRIYLGVHWTSDVLAGWAAGACLLLVGTAVHEPARAPAQ